MKCPKCGSDKVVKHGFKTLANGKAQQYQCDSGHIFHEELHEELEEKK